MTLFVNGEPLASRRDLPTEMLAQGVVLLLAGQIALVLQNTVLEPPLSCAPEIVGESASILQLRREIQRIADLDFQVLLRGESGTGKELAARAIHDSGPRRDSPFLALNMGALPRELAAAELFGAVKGAYTGAGRTRPGYFQQASGGTLFLDEIGEASPEVQVLLLRALETGQVQRVGSSAVEDVNVRVISATDVELETAVDSGTFRLPLLHRLAGYELFLPPLRDRREDFGRLFFRFLGQELRRIGDAERLVPASGQKPWIDAELLSQLALLPWPGNVRQLKNVVRQLVVASRGSDRIQIPKGVERLLTPAATTSVDSPRTEASIAVETSLRRAEEVSDDELLTALRSENFIVSRAARRLGVSKTALYKRMDQCPRVRKASELDVSEIEATVQQFPGDPRAMALALEVSPRGLRLRMGELGLL